MSPRREETELHLALEAAAREADAVDASVTRRRAWRAGAGARRTRRRIVASLWVVAALGSIFAWTTLSVDGPTEEQLRQGRELVLKLASDWTREYMRRHGAPPTSVAAALPVAASVKIDQVPDGVRLTLPNEDGPPSSVTVPLPRKP